METHKITNEFSKNKTLKSLLIMHVMAYLLSGKQERERNIKLYNAIQINKVGEKRYFFGGLISPRYCTEVSHGPENISHIFLNLHFFYFLCFGTPRYPSISYVNG